MITKINMNQVKSYKSLTTLTTNKKINLIYGLNGVGKSTISDYLYDQTNIDFANCSIEGLSDDEILVYNQRFIREYFYQPDSLKCIFTLSKENKEAEEKVRDAEKEIDRLKKDRLLKSDEIDSGNLEFETKKQNAENIIWEVKTKYSGGDRVLEYCLDGLKGKKETLFTYLANVTKPESQPQKTTDQLKKEVDAIKGNTAQKYDSLPQVNLNIQAIESNPIFGKSIIGNENSSVAALIKNMGNSDWVKEGLEFISKDIDSNNELCPFCQEKTITKSLVQNIKNYFDESYEKDLKELNKVLSDYELDIESLPTKETYESNSFILENKSDFENLYNAVISCLDSNVDKIKKKIKTPSRLIALVDSNQVIKDFNTYIDKINRLINDHNNKIQNKDNTLNDIKKQFWVIMRWEYDQTISAYKNDKSASEKKLNDLNDKVKKIDKNVAIQKNIITEQQKKTINIEDAIMNINNGLLELGIDGFHIEKHTDVLYTIVRNEQCGNTFESLSEGEKMIISFLYFRELCRGKKSATSTNSKKIAVIDDPISSLSHIYIFNIGQMIKNDFFNSPVCEQVFLLTHSLYFFYEMTFTNPDKRKEKQKLFRISKNSEGSHILEMKYEEIQNDYHSYWYIVKDDKQPPALIANCMRNIIEYFFDFIEKKDLNKVFQEPELQATRYQAFYRYINRESHSIGQNVFDIKEFDYANFKDAFRLVFVKSGYEEHYNKMMR